MADGHIQIEYPALKGHPEPLAAARLDITFNEPKAILKPGKEQTFKIRVVGEITDPRGGRRTSGASGYIHMNDTEAIGFVATAVVLCGRPIPTEECVLHDEDEKEAKIEMPTIFPGFVENHRRVRIGAGATPCGSCFVSYEYEAQLRPTSAKDDE